MRCAGAGQPVMPRGSDRLGGRFRRGLQPNGRLRDLSRPRAGSRVEGAVMDDDPDGAYFPGFSPDDGMPPSWLEGLLDGQDQTSRLGNVTPEEGSR